jgi:plasmid maintenance system antidote protein VapI
MAHADDLDPYASLAEWLASEVRKYRDRAGMEQQELAKHLRVSFQHMNNLEANRRKFTREHARTLDGVFGTDEHFVTLWVHSQREHDQEWFQKFTSFERRAREIKIWQPLVIPGLFQTAQYARALLESARTPDAEAVVESRMKRQEILEREDPPLIFALIDERALRQPVPGPEAMREQLRRLLEIAALPHVIIQVVPMATRAHIGLDGGFVLLDLGQEEGQVAFIEAQLTGRLVRDEQEVRTLAVRYDRIRAKALSEEDSVRLIQTIMEQM